MSVQIPVEAKLDSAEIDKVLQKLTEQMNRLGSAVAQANKIKFNPVSQAALTDLQKVTHQFDSLRKISGDLGKRLKATGQGSTGFFDLDWKRLYTDPSVRARKMRQQFEYVTAGTGASFTSSTPSPPGIAPRTPRPPEPPAPPPSPGASWRQAGRGVVGAGLRAAGPVGGVADSAISSGMSGGAMAGLAGLVGGIAALGVGKLIGGIANKVGDAQNDAIGYDTLKRVLGDVNVSFGMLQQSLHASSDAIDVTYAQVLKLGNEFAHISGISGKLSETLAEEVRVGGGFGRSFGIDPSQSNAFFAQMRQFKVTNTEGDSRQLALYIGEAVAKSGAFSKADEMLQAIASYTAQQTRLGLTAANVGDYSSLLAGLVGSHTPGLDPMGAANLLSRVNGAFTSGGGAGEAGQNFMYMALGKQLGLNPIQSSILREQGAFGTGSVTFGKGSLYSQFAQKYGMGTPGTAAGSNETNMQMVMRRMQSVYAGKPELMLSAMSNLFGVNTSQAMALATIGPEKLGGLQKALAANNVDLTKMSSTGISALAQIYNGDRGTLKEQARALFPRLSTDEAKKLDASGGDTEKLRGELVKLTAKYGQEETEGSQTRKTIQDLDKDMIDAASKMIGPLNTMRDTLLYAFGNRGSMTAEDMHKKVVEAQKKEVNNRADARIEEARKKAIFSSSGLGFGYAAPSKARIKEMGDAADNLKSETAAANKERADALAKIDADNYTGPPGGDKKNANNLPVPAWMSGGADGAGGGSPGSSAQAPRNLRNNNPGNIEYGTFAKQHGAIGSDGRFAIFPDAQSGSAAMDALLTQYATKDHLDTVAGIVGKWAPSKENNSAAYAARVAKRMGVAADAHLNMADPRVRQALGREMASIEGSQDSYRLGTPLPNGSSASAGSDAKSAAVHVTGEFHLTGPNGQPAAAPVTVTKKVGAPMALGSTGSW